MTSDTTVPVFAPAKINLCLHVTGQRADGYHLLDSVVAFADFGDRLWFEPSDNMTLSITGPFAQGVPTNDTNLVWRAAVHAGASQAITLEKNLPHGAGIGGGSSDAAAVLRHFERPEVAASLGADVPVCLQSCAQRMQGIGDELAQLPSLPPLWAVLANPGVHLSTPQVFTALNQKQNSAMPSEIPAFVTARDAITWLDQTRNDLQIPAIRCAPVIENVINALTAVAGAHAVRMSGSGATCFALFETQDAARAGAKTLAQEYPDWWIKDCALS